MEFIDEHIQSYMEAFSSKEPVLLQQLRRETWQKILNPRMLSGHQQGRFLSLLSHILRPKRILEIGTYTGYATLCLAEGLTRAGEIHTIDINEELHSIQQKYFRLSGYDKQIITHTGNALNIIPDLPGIFDLIFLDADKRNYPVYYELIKNKIQPGSVLIADNVLWSGKVISKENHDAETWGINKFNEIVKSDNSTQQVILPLRDGLSIVRFV
jgi:predicted O-methyltransferase YrrM